eukprot:Hpha_TRINITY_DN16969_c2_g1::TRINITY_DN16969_c2_g1_i1::g.52006::m.52006/K04905/KCNH2; potassium voltage-gated channel Eag-related subfamily H member 2
MFDPAPANGATTMTESRALLQGLPKETLRRYKRLFQVFDQDGDGQIDPAELKIILNTVGVPADDEDAEEMILAYDTNGSGVVEFDEFLMIMLDHGGEAACWQGKGAGLAAEGGADEFMKKSDEAVRHVRAALVIPRVLPDSALRLSMDMGVMFVCAYYYVTTLLYDVNHKLFNQYQIPSIVLECAISCFLICDIIITFNTAAIRRNSLVTDRTFIAKNYLHGWFWVDFLAALPVDLIVFATGNAPEPINGWTHLRLVKILKVFPRLQLFPILNPGVMSARYVKIHFGWLPPFIMVYKLCLIIHTLTVVWIALQDCDIDDSCDYITAVYWVLYTITSVGYGDVTVRTGNQKVYACFLFLTGILTNGLLIGYLTVFVMQSDVQGDTYDKMRQTLAVLQHFGVPSSLQEEMLSFQFHVLENNLGASYADLIAGLPVPMQDQVSVYIRIRHVSQVPMFSRTDMSVRAALAQALKNVVVPPEEYVIVEGEQGHEMFFLSHGFCDVTSGGTDPRFMATISKGGFFGEVALLVETKRTANIKALTFCDLFILRKYEFDVILDSFPSFADAIQEEIRKRRRRRQTLQTIGEPEAAGDEFGMCPVNVDEGAGDELADNKLGKTRASIDVVAAVAHMRRVAHSKKEPTPPATTQSSSPPSAESSPSAEVEDGPTRDLSFGTMAVVMQKLDSRARLAREKKERANPLKKAKSGQISSWRRPRQFDDARITDTPEKAPPTPTSPVQPAAAIVPVATSPRSGPEQAKTEVSQSLLTRVKSEKDAVGFGEAHTSPVGLNVLSRIAGGVTEGGAAGPPTTSPAGTNLAPRIAGGVTEGGRRASLTHSPHISQLQQRGDSWRGGDWLRDGLQRRDSHKQRSLASRFPQGGSAKGGGKGPDWFDRGDFSASGSGRTGGTQTPSGPLLRVLQELQTGQEQMQQLLSNGLREIHTVEARRMRQETEISKQLKTILEHVEKETYNLNARKSTDSSPPPTPGQSSAAGGVFGPPRVMNTLDIHLARQTTSTPSFNSGLSGALPGFSASPTVRNQQMSRGSAQFHREPSREQIGKSPSISQ